MKPNSKTFKLFFIALLLVVISSLSVFAAPSVVNPDGSYALTETSILARATLDVYNDIYGFVSVGFRYRELGTTTWIGLSVQNVGGPISYTATIPGLKAGTDYEIQAWAKDGSIYRYATTIETVRTLGVAIPSIYTYTPLSITSNSANFMGELEDLGSSSSVSVGFQYRQQGTSTWLPTATQSRTTEGFFYRSISGLTPSTTYEVRTIVFYGSQSLLGNIRTFTTSSLTIPTVATITPTSITENSFIMQGSVTSLGDYSSVGRGFQYRIQGEPMWNEVSLTATGSTGSFNRLLDGLVDSTTYEYQAFVSYAAQGFREYGTTRTATTSTPPEPEVEVANVTVLAQTSTIPTATSVKISVYHNFINPTFGKAGVQVAVNGTDAWTTWPFAYGVGTQSGSGVKDIEIINLQAGTTYKYRATASYEFESASVILLDDTIGYFTTSTPEIPIAEFLSIEDITYNTARLRGSIISFGGFSDVNYRFMYKEVGTDLPQYTNWKIATTLGPVEETIEVQAGKEYAVYMEVQYEPFNADLNQDNKGTVSGGVTIEDGAMVFDGVDDYVQIPDSNSLDLSSAGTWSLWVNAKSQLTTPDGHRPLDKLSAYGITVGKTNGRVDFINVGLSSTYVLGTGTNVYTNSWNHILITYDGSNVRFYQNNVLKNTVAVTGNISNSANALLLSQNTIRSFNGSISDVRIFNRTLTTTEITEIYNAGTDSYSPVTDGLVAQYSGKDFEGTTSDPTSILNVLRPGVLYTSGGTFESSQVPGILAVTTYIVSNLGDTSVNFRGEVVDMGGLTPVTAYFEYRKKGAITWTASNKYTVLNTGSYQDFVENLEIGTTYEYRARVDAESEFASFSDHGLTFEFTTIGQATTPGETTTTDDFDLSEIFGMFGGEQTKVKFIVAMVMIIGLFLMTFQATHTVVGGLFGALIGLIMSVVMGLISIWLLVIIILMLALPIVLKVMFWNNS